MDAGNGTKPRKCAMGEYGSHAPTHMTIIVPRNNCQLGEL